MNDDREQPAAAGWPPPGQPNEIGADAALQERLARLADQRAASATTAAPTKRTTTPTGRRRHAASRSRVATLVLSVASTGGLAALFATTDAAVSASPAAPVGIVPVVDAAAAAPATAAPMVNATQPAPTQRSIPTSPDTAASSAAPSTTASTAPTSTAPNTTVLPALNVIEVNGQSFSNKWGDVQVQATFSSDGTLVAVDTLQTPTRDGKSVRINARAVPQLNSSALTAQTARIDTVSGATYTSVGYRDSLQSAIDIAAANGLATPTATV